MNIRQTRPWMIAAALSGEISPDDLSADEQSEYAALLLEAMENPTQQEVSFFNEMAKKAATHKTN